MTPIVLIPGLLCSAEIFAPQVPALWPYGPVTIASTLCGDSMAEMAAAILADAPPRFILGGISMGGMLGFEIMRQAPERVEKLALISTYASPDTPDQLPMREGMLAAARANFAGLLTQSSKMSLHPSQQDNVSLTDIIIRMGLTVGLPAFERQMRAMMERADSRPGLNAINVPTLIIIGDADPLSPVERSELMNKSIPNSRLVVIPECGHASTLEKPEAVSNALTSWLSEGA